VKVANITGLYGFDVRLLWDPIVLEHVSHTGKTPVQTYPGGVLNQPTFTLKDEVNETIGSYWYASSSLSPALGFDGDGTFFEITFRVKKIDRCLLEVFSELADTLGNPIDHERRNGFFSNYVPAPAEVYVAPDKIIDADLTPCHNFTISVHIDSVIDLRDFEFWLGYNTTILDIVEVAVNPIFASPVVEISEAGGTLRVAGSVLPSVSGDFAMANVTFHVVATGDSILDLYDITLTDDWDEAIPYKTPADGYFSNVLKAKLFVFPPEIIDPTMTPGTTFSIDIQVDDVFDLYGYSFSLSYDTYVLVCLGVIIVPPNTDPHFLTEISVDDPLGEVSVSVDYYSPAPPITLLSNTTMVTIFFMVQNYGCTVLDLHDTLLTNPSGDPITHEVGDGFFCTLIADVAIVWVEPSRNFVYPGRIVDIIVVAANLGDLTTTFNVTAYYDNNTIGTQTVVNVPPGHNRTLVFAWNTTGLEPCNNFTISAYASPVPYELDFTNNYYEDGWVKIKIIGDVNNDGAVDIFDIVLASGAYGSQAGDLDYNPEADVAPRYGIIDIFDMVTVASHYGEGC
jgi:hypothetical protein